MYWVYSPFVQGLAAILTAVATVVLALFAVWGDSLKAVFVDPRIELSLRSTVGGQFPWTDGTKVVYYHLTVTNVCRLLAHRIPAQQVRVFVTRIAKRIADGSFAPLPMVYPLQLSWSPSEFREPFRTVVHAEVADFGYLVQGNPAFKLSTIVAPKNFPGEVKAGEAMRVEIEATGLNAYSTQALVIQIDWDGAFEWDDTERQKHLVVKEVPSLR